MKECLTLGGLDFTVEKSPNTHIIGDTQITSDKSFFTYRTDSNTVLASHVGSKYTVVQNEAALGILENIPYQVESAGALDSGRISWVLMKSDCQIVVEGDDVTELYLLLYNSFDGSSQISIRFTPVRVVCWNTLSAALRGGSHIVSIRHTASAEGWIADALRILKQTEKVCQRLNVQFDQMARTLVDPVNFISQVMFTRDELKGIVEGTYKLTTRKQNQLIGALEYYETGPGQPDWKGTAWGAYNAITGYFGGDFGDEMFGQTYDKYNKKAGELALDYSPFPADFEKIIFN